MYVRVMCAERKYFCNFLQMLQTLGLQVPRLKVTVLYHRGADPLPLLKKLGLWLSHYWIRRKLVESPPRQPQLLEIRVQNIWQYVEHDVHHHLICEYDGDWAARASAWQTSPQARERESHCNSDHHHIAASCKTESSSSLWVLYQNLNIYRYAYKTYVIKNISWNWSMIKILFAISYIFVLFPKLTYFDGTGFILYSALEFHNTGKVHNTDRTSFTRWWTA